MARYAKELWIDTENRSPYAIKNVGGYKHARTCEALLVAWAINDGPAYVWDVYNSTFTIPNQLADALNDPAYTVIAHGAHYDRNALAHALNIYIPVSRWRCSMALAYSLGLVGKLETLGVILGLPEDKQKLTDGRKLIQRFCKPRRPSKKNPNLYWEPADDFDRWSRFIEYARMDVNAMRECVRRMPLWNYRGSEVSVWKLDQLINDRGVGVDREAILALDRTVQREVALLNDETEELTDGEIQSATQRDAFLAYLNDRFGAKMESIDKETVERFLLRPDLDDPVFRRLLQIRQRVARTSTAKLSKMLQASSPRLNGTAIDVVQGCFQYAGAARTGRWAGRLVQLQNPPRGTLKSEQLQAAVEDALADGLDLLYDNPMEIAASCVRPCLVPPPGSTYEVSDLSNIEGRVLPWLAGEQWKLDVFAAFDRGEGNDPYLETYAATFNVLIEYLGSHERQVGKVEELAFGYQGGVGAFQKMSATYHVDIGEHYNTIWESATSTQRAKAKKLYARARKRGESIPPKHTFLAADIVKQKWREAHPKVVAFWYDTERAAINAVNHPKYSYTAGRVTWTMRGKWLLAQLPSGRYLAYYNPRIEDGVLWFDGTLQKDNKQAQWVSQPTYGGKLVENLTQAVARDVLAWAMLRLHKAGFYLVGHVHDEVITERADTAPDTLAELNDLLATPPPWSDGLPLAATGFTAKRYRKD
jgi:DNA polymerase